MKRATTAISLALAAALGGAALAQQATEVDRAGTDVGAPASGETGVKGVYSLKSTMGISTGSTTESMSKDGGASSQDEEGSVENRGEASTSD